MKTLKRIAPWIVLLIWSTLGHGQNEFPIGFFTFGNNNTAQGLTQMDSTNATWVQVAGQSGNPDDTSIFTTMLQNTQGLKVIAIRTWNIFIPSRSQRMVFEAEQSADPSKNYFQTHSTGAVDGTAWRALLGTHGVGYMARDMIPDDEYHFDRNNYIATFVMKITATGVPSKQVATLSIVDENTGNTLASRILTEADFPDANYRAQEVSFTLPPPPAPPQKPFGQLQGTMATSSDDVKHVDVRVYWHGLVTTWLDVVWVEDTITTPDPSDFARWGAYQLFPRFGSATGAHDTEIENDAELFKSATSYPLLQRFYLNDEPPLNGYLSYGYIDNLLIQANPDNLSQGRGRGIAAYSDNKFQRFFSESQVRELFVDIYPIHADVPSPSIQDDSKAQQNGIAIYTDSPTYNTALQGRLEVQISQLNSAISAANAASPKRSLWFIAQAHGELCDDTGKYRKGDDSGPLLRPPTPNELRVTVNLSLAYGAKGVFFYPYGTDALGEFGECSAAWSVGLVRGCAITITYS